MTKGIAPARPPLHVLVVEDQPEPRERLVELLRAHGCRVDAAADGLGAVRGVLAVDPDIVLMDLGLPSLDGWDAIRTIRRKRPEPPPYIIALSSFADADSRRLAFEAGCNEYIVKPLDVTAALRAFVARRGHRQPPALE